MRVGDGREHDTEVAWVLRSISVPYNAHTRSVWRALVFPAFEVGHGFLAAGLAGHSIVPYDMRQALGQRVI